ncbi:MAG: hypothetical protein INR66_23155 [Gordonia polyisoprenivorans]|nr:hypothetical protein [Gordonia polyisoprenivorans]
MSEQYRLILGSEMNPRDGMYVELLEVSSENRVAQVFEDDETGALTFTSFTTHPVPLEAIEKLVASAHREFPSPHLRDGRSSDTQ